MNGFICILLFGAISLGIASALVAWLARNGYSFVKLRIETRAGKFELLAAKNRDALIVSEDQLASFDEVVDKGIET